MLARIALLLVIFSLASGGDVYQQKFPSPTGSTITSAMWGDDLYIITGTDGTLLQSTDDGFTWNQCDSPSDGDYLNSMYANEFYISTDLNYQVIGSEDADCSNPDTWTVYEHNGPYPGGIRRFAPNPVPTGWNDGFVICDGYRIYYSATGNYDDYELFQGIDYTQYQAWAVVSTGNDFIIKLAAIPTTTISNSTIFDIFTMSLSDGLTYSQPLNTTFTSYADYGIGYTVGNTLIMACFDGIIQSLDGGDTWNIIASAPGMYVFDNLICSGSRCLGTKENGIIYDSSNSGVSFSETTLEDLTFIHSNFPSVSYDAQDPNGVSFIIGSYYGIIYTSNSPELWVRTGADESNDFFFCEDITSYSGLFLMSCQSSILVSDDALDWEKHQYFFQEGVQLGELTIADDIVVSFSGNSIYSSSDVAVTWDRRVTLSLQPDDNFVIFKIVHHNDKWIVMAQDQWTIVDGDEEGTVTEVPIIVISEDLKTWDLYASDTFIYDMVYLDDEDTFIGAGKNGVYSSNNLFEWERIESSSGECTTITGDGDDNWMALCSNMVNSQVTLMVSTDEGDSWDTYTSPCELRTPAANEIQTVTCKGLQYVDKLDGYVLYSEDYPAGIMYYADNDGVSWNPVEVPYSLRIYGVTEENDLFATLAKDAVYSGDSEGTLPLGDTTLSQEYSGSTDAPDAPEYQISPGYIITEPIEVTSSFEVPTSFDASTFDASSFRNNQYEENHSDGGSNAGMITGILFAILVLCVILVLIVLAAVYGHKKLAAQRFADEQAKLLNQENDML